MASTVITLKNFHILKSFKWAVSSTHLRQSFSSLKCRKLLFNHKTFPSLGYLSSPKNFSSKASFETRGNATYETKGLDASRPLDRRDHRADNDPDEFEGFEEGEEDTTKSLLSATVTPELEQEILGGKSALKFKNVLYEIVKLENKKYPFPLPTELTVDQWRTLLSFDDPVTRMYYLDNLRWTETKEEKLEDLKVFTLEELHTMDRQNSSPISEQITEEMIEKACGVSGDDEESRRRINLLLMVHEMQRQKGEKMPISINLRDLENVAKEMKGERQILKYLDYMNIKELRKMSDFIQRRCTLAKSEPAKAERLENISKEPHLYYGLGQNCILLRTADRTMDKVHNWNAIREFNDWGTPLVIDFSFLAGYRTTGSSMKSLLYSEMPYSITNNRMAEQPFQLHFTGVTTELQVHMEKVSPGISSISSCVNITDKNVVDMFDPERLVYLSPDSRNDLKEINPDDVYVIGGIIDKHDRQPLTLSRAKRQGIRHARFPMKRIMNLKAELNIDTCVAVMCDMKASQDWFYSLRWVPSRYFANRIKDIENPNPEHQLAYRCHRALSPTIGDKDRSARMRIINAKKYREMYQRIAKANSREEMDQIMQELVV